MQQKVGRPVGSSRAKQTIGKKEMKVLFRHIHYKADLHSKTRRRWWQVSVLSFYLGTRISELLDLTVGDLRDAVARGESSLSNKTKTKTPRLLIFSQNSIKVIKRYFADELRTGRNTDLLFYSPKGKNCRLNSASYTRQFNELIHDALGNLYSTHSFRKGVISDMSLKSINPKIIQSFIGHKNLQTTMNYFSPSDTDVKNAIAIIR